MSTRFSSLVAAILFLAPALVFAQTNNEAKKLYNEGNAKLRSGDFAGAITLYDQALKIEDHEHLYYQKGLALRKAKKESEAMEAFQAAVKKNPKFAVGYTALAGGYHIQKDYDKAIESYEKALVESPTLGQAKKGLASSQAAKATDLINGGDYDKAIALANKSIANDPNFSKAYIILAQAYNKNGKYKEAVTAAESAIKTLKTGNKGAAYFEMGLAHRNMGNTAQAKAAFTEAKKDPTWARNAEYELKQLK